MLLGKENASFRTWKAAFWDASQRVGPLGLVLAACAITDITKGPLVYELVALKKIHLPSQAPGFKIFPITTPTSTLQSCCGMKPHTRGHTHGTPNTR